MAQYTVGHLERLERIERLRRQLPGLALAGDWTASGLPATLEGAVRSGRAAAESVWDVRASAMLPPRA